MTDYLGSVIVMDGYAGNTMVLHLCREPGTSGRTLGVHAGGWFTYDDPCGCATCRKDR